MCMCVLTCVFAFCGFLAGLWLFHSSTGMHLNNKKKEKEALHYKREWDTNRLSHTFILTPASPVLSQPLPSFNHVRKHKRAHSTDGLKPPPFLSLKLFRPNCSTDHKCHIRPSSSSSSSRYPQCLFSSDVCDYLCRIDQMCFWLLTCYFSMCRDLSENQIQAIPRKAFRGITSVKNL